MMILRIILGLIALFLIARLIAYFFFGNKVADEVVDFLGDARQIAVIIIIVVFIGLALK